MKNRHIIATLAIAGAIVSLGSVNARANTFNTQIVGNLGNYNYLHMRSSATVNSQIIDNIPKGQEVQIIGEANGWAKVQYDGEVGFVSSYYLVGSSQNDNSNNNISASNNIVYTNYNTTINRYARMQHNNWNGTSVNGYENYVNPANASSKYEFLRIDRYREINTRGLNNVLNDMGVLDGQAQVINDAALTYNLDPIYLAAQTILETGKGQSTLAQGVTISEIANTNRPIYQNGLLVGYQMIKLSKPVTVFNLYGIGAKNNLPGFPNRALILGTTYAYKQGWTSVPKAIYGAARFISNIYVNSGYNQNTPYKLRYNPNVYSIWHEYATTPYYGQSIGNLISQYSYLYSENDKFLYDKPVFND